MKKHSQAVLIILDGWGYREDPTHNAVAAARTPVFDRLWNTYPHALLEASGLAVGLPEGQMGNSEVGHMTIGAGKPLDQDLVRIQKSIDSGEFGSMPAFLALFDHVKTHDSTLHVMGLLSDGGVHSHMDHLFAFLRAAQTNGVHDVALHIFTDGRDVAPQSAAGHMKKLEEVLEEVKIGRIVSISGRAFAMDRDKNWDRVKKATDAMFEGAGNTTDMKPSEYLADLYAKNLGNGSLDEHIVPTVFVDGSGKENILAEHDGIFFFNFRSDRARQMSQKILEQKNAKDLVFVTLTEYDPEYSREYGAQVVFPKLTIETTLAKEVSLAGMSQAHIAETEKFPHATYFLNGGVEKPHENETHIMLESRKDVATHDLAPKMRAEGIADAAIEQIQNGVNFIFINFANPDMVGHTANVPAIIEAVEEVDTQLGRVIEVLEARGGVAFVTADHGNAEVNIDLETGEKHTSHTTNLVPAIVTDAGLNFMNGTLADIAPTILAFLGVNTPKSMIGKILVVEK